MKTLIALNTLTGTEYVSPMLVAHLRPNPPAEVPKAASATQRARLEDRNKVKTMVVLENRVAVIGSLDSASDIAAKVAAALAEK